MTAKRYILAGSGSRGLGMFARPVTFDEELIPHAEIIGFFDNSPARMEFARKELKKPEGFPCYTDFDAMLKEVPCDGIIVASKDCTHAEIIVKSLKAGKRVFSEKPVCTDDAQVRDILAAEAASSEEVYVTHNMRYGPAFSKIKELLDDGIIGRMIFVEYNDYLDRHHGADYFRRWHGLKVNSGGLTIHKSSHHYDILNYTVGAFGKTLYATGGTAFYGKQGPFRGERCSNCEHSRECSFHADLFDSEKTRGMYQDAEADSGYVRDGCLFREEITTEDNFHSVFDYENGVRGVYTLTAFCPFEGYRVVYAGTKGRLEYTTIGSAAWAPGKNDTPGLSATAERTLRAVIVGEGVTDFEIPTVEGGHGGADPALRRDFFIDSWESSERKPRMASLMEGCQAVLMGQAANIAMSENRVVNVQDLLNA